MDSEDKGAPTQTQRQRGDEERWGTWEELLLACAVKRHGFRNWDSVSMELQTRTSLPHFLTSAHNCRQKYSDLHRRFTLNKNDHHQQQDEKQDIHIPWLEQLRKLRVDELKQELHRYDISIHSLQLKVKRLEEEREKSLKLNDDVPLADLENHTWKSGKKEEEVEKKVSTSGDESDRENRSVNESNSTCSEKKEVAEALLAQDGKPVMSGSNSKPVESQEVGDSATQLSSEVQSSASLGGKGKRKLRNKKEEAEAEAGGGGGDAIKGMAMTKSEPLVRLMETIRAHKYASLFEALLHTQETDSYRNMIRQHMDLETLQTRLDQGFYSCSNLSSYRDLLLLFNNAIVFFPKSSNESTVAFQLRSLVSNEMRQESPTSELLPLHHHDNPPPSQLKRQLERSDSLLVKQKASAPIVVCRKRSSLSAKAKPSSSPSFSTFGQKTEQQQQQSNDDESPSDPKPSVVEQSSLKIEPKEKPVTGTRSSRRSKKTLATKGTTQTPPSKKANASPATEAPKTDKRKSEALALDKKRSAADFLKRINKNSPVQTPKKNSKESGSGGGEAKKDNSAAKGKKGKANVEEIQVEETSNASKRNGGRTMKKGVEVTKASGKHGSEGGGGGKNAAKRPKKRSRR